MTVELISYPNVSADICGKAAAICTGAEDTKKALRTSMKSGHLSVLEHACFTFRITGVSRVLLAQLTRHRIASFSVKSQRYVDHSKAHYYIPGLILKDEKAREIALNAMAQAADAYSELLKLGISKEDARYVLPQGVTTDLVLTMNARELHHFFSLRCCNRAQAEIRQLADLMLQSVREVAPEIFRVAGPSCVIEGICHEAKSCGKPRAELIMTEGPKE